MKESMNWYGELPERWKSRRLKSLVSDINEKSSPNGSFYVGMENVVPWTGSFLSTNSSVTGECKRFNIDDILFGKLRPYLAKVYLPRQSGVCSGEFLVLRGFDGVPSFLKYMLLSYRFVMYVNSSTYGAKMPRANWDFIGNCAVPLPPPSEQSQIVRYLDWKVSSINKLINGKKKQIELLKEKRKTMINEEFQKISRHNKECVQRLKNKVSDTNEKASPIGSFYIGMENIISWLGQFIDTGSSAEGDCKRFQKGDILFGKLRPYLAKVYAPDSDGVCSGEFLVLRGYDGYLPYLKYLLLSDDFVMLVNASTYGAKMPRANWTFIGNCYLPFPAVEEQKTIVHTLDLYCTKIDNLSTKLQQEIKLLEELRTILISDVVTGKIDVRGVVIPEFETVEETVDVENNEIEEQDDEQ